MWKVSLTFFIFFLVVFIFFFFKEKKISTNFFLTLIILKIVSLIIYDLSFNDKYKSFYAKYRIDSDGYINLARQYVGLDHYDRNIGGKIDLKKKNYHFFNFKNFYYLVNNKDQSINKFDKNLTLISNIKYQGKIINSSFDDQFFYFAYDDGSISKNEISSLKIIKKEKILENDFITALKIVNEDIYFGTFKGKIGKSSKLLNNKINYIGKSILSINKIVKHENQIFFSSVDGSIKNLIQNEKIRNFFQSPKKIINFYIDEKKIFILRNSANLKVCDINFLELSCKEYGDNLNFFTNIFFTQNMIVLGDAFGGITKIKKNNLDILNNQSHSNYFAPHKSFINFIDFDEKEKNLISVSSDYAIILQDQEMNILNKIYLSKNNKEKIFGVFYDNFRLPGYPILSAISMKFLNLESALAIKIVQKIALIFFVLWLFKKMKNYKINDIGYGIVTFFIMFPFSVIIQFADSDLTEFILFLFFSLLAYFSIFEKNTKKKHFVISLIILLGSLIKSTFILIVIFWFLSFLIFNFFYKKKEIKQNLYYIIFAFLTLVATTLIFKQQAIYNSGILPSYIISLDKMNVTGSKNDNLSKKNNNIDIFLSEVAKLKLSKEEQHIYILESLGYYDYLVMPIYYNGFEIKSDDIKKYSLEIIFKNNINYLYFAFKSKLTSLKEINLVPGSYGSNYYKDSYYLVHITLIILFYIFLYFFIYGIYIYLKKDKILSLKLISFLIMYVFFFIFLHDNLNQRYFFPVGIIYYFYVFLGLSNFLNFLKIRLT